MPEIIRAPDGLYGVAVSETSVSRGSDDSSLTYRGYPIKELFDKASFEECAFLILEGRLPRRSELDGFVENLRLHSRVPENVSGSSVDWSPGARARSIGPRSGADSFQQTRAKGS